MNQRDLIDSKSRAVLLIGHGTRDEVGTQQFFALGSHLSSCLHPLPVETALLEFQRPTIPEAWSALVDRGATHVHVAPLLLFAAGHAKEDIPSVIADCQAKSPHVSWDQSRSLSRHPGIVTLVMQRLADCLHGIDAPPERIAVVMVGRGSHDPCAQADMRVLSEVISRRVNVCMVATAFYAMAQPRLPDVLKEIAGSGNYDHVVVQPHLLFAGRLYQAIVRQTEAAAASFSSVRFQTSRYLGPDKLVAGAIARRIG